MELEVIFKDFVKALGTSLDKSHHETLLSMSPLAMHKLVKEEFLNRKIENITYMNLCQIAKKSKANRKTIQNYMKLFDEYFRLKKREEAMVQQNIASIDAQQLDQLTSMLGVLGGGGSGGGAANMFTTMNSTMALMSGLMANDANVANVANAAQSSVKKFCDDVDILTIVNSNVHFLPKILGILMKEDITQYVDVTKIKFDPSKPYIDNLRAYVNSDECETLIEYIENKIKEVLDVCGLKQQQGHRQHDVIGEENENEDH
jgi:hypothetical protein